MNDQSSFYKFRLREWPRRASDIQAYMDPTFATIAARYDFMTRAMSFGLEQGWKKKAVNFIPRKHEPGRVLDLACGTGDFPLHLRAAGFSAPIFGLDRNPGMLKISKEKCAAAKPVSFVQADLTAIPLKERSFNVITMGYALRYVVDIRRTLTDVFRLLDRGGIFVCLDFGVPTNRLYRRLCFGYLFLLGSLWGWLIHGNADTYWHIVESLKAYPGQGAVAAWLKEVGFEKIVMREQLGGIITIVSATRP